MTRHMRTKLIVKMALGLALLCAGAAAGAQTMMNVPARKATSLDGYWNNIIDPYGHGNGNYMRDRTFDGTRLQDYDFDTSPELKVPGDWNTQNPKYYYYEGIMWYRTKFNYDLTPGNRLFVHFEAANYKTSVWVNGRLAGEHEGGYTGFEYEITSLLRPGQENSLVVRVNNQRLPDGVPTMNTDWWNYGGITRSVYLVETAPTFIYDYSVQLSKDRTKIEGWIRLKGDDVAAKDVQLAIPELKISNTYRTGADGIATFSLKAKPELWSPESPKLYDVAVQFGGESISDRIGFRTIETKGDKILLNGKEVFLAGINLHEETVGDSRRANCKEDDVKLLTMAKELGCNFVRLAHYPHNADMTRTADELGLMVWSEIPLYWGINWRNEGTYTLAVQQLTEMISRDRNRASIIIWSIANETSVNAERTAFLSKLAGEARSLDGTRLISAALQNVNKQLAPNLYTVEDPLHEALDLFSFNEYIGWYDATKEACDVIEWSLPADKPIVISEFGGGGRRGRHSGPDAYFSEDNMVDLYRHQFIMLGKIKGLAGTIPWVLKDFRSPHRVLQGIQDDFNRKGIYDDKGRKKEVWNVLKEWNDAHR